MNLASLVPFLLCVPSPKRARRVDPFGSSWPRRGLVVPTRAPVVVTETPLTPDPSAARAARNRCSMPDCRARGPSRDRCTHAPPSCDCSYRLRSGLGPSRRRIHRLDGDGGGGLCHPRNAPLIDFIIPSPTSAIVHCPFHGRTEAVADFQCAGRLLLARGRHSSGRRGASSASADRAAGCGPFLTPSTRCSLPMKRNRPPMHPLMSGGIIAPSSQRGLMPLEAINGGHEPRLPPPNCRTRCIRTGTHGGLSLKVA